MAPCVRVNELLARSFLMKTVALMGDTDVDVARRHGRRRAQRVR